MGGQVGISDHAKVGNRVMIGAQSGVVGKVKDDSIVLGSPAMSHTVWRRAALAIPKLPELLKRVRRLEKMLESREAE
jgi:UDP-3-O-[3-hydroxymyristoyl] glucosamine N-acyltransferase